LTFRLVFVDPAKVHFHICALESAKHQEFGMKTMSKSEFSEKSAEYQLALETAGERRDLIRSAFNITLSTLQKRNATFSQVAEDVLSDLRSPDWLMMLVNRFSSM
jgi:hypothetical protein